MEQNDPDFEMRYTTAATKKTLTGRISKRRPTRKGEINRKLRLMTTPKTKFNKRGLETGIYERTKRINKLASTRTRTVTNCKEILM
jgi:hypothetical protein